MHPQIRKEEPGDCPICGMELIPASTMEESVDPDAIVMSKTARQLAQVETTTVGNQDYEFQSEFFRSNGNQSRSHFIDFSQFQCKN